MASFLAGHTEGCSQARPVLAAKGSPGLAIKISPVGSWLLPTDISKHVYAAYAFCCGVDELGDKTSDIHQ